MASGLGALFCLTGLVLLGAAWLGATGGLKRNRIAGMRTRSTLASDEAWYAGQRASAWSVAAAGLMTAASGIALLAAQPADETTGRVALVVGAIDVVVLIVGGVQANRAAKAAAR